MKRVAQILGVGLVQVVLGGCGIPVEVSRVPSADTAVEGVRYYLYRPEFKASLRYAGKKVRGAWSDGYDVVLQQKLVRGEQYEIKPSGYLLSNTEVALKVDEDGKLLSFSAGEDDQTGELITAIASLATAAGTGARPAQGEQEPAEITEHKLEHRTLIEHRDEVAKRLTSLRGDLGGPQSVALQAAQQIPVLEKELERATKAVQDHLLPLPNDKVRLEVWDAAGKVSQPVPGFEGTSPWVTIQLREDF